MTPFSLQKTTIGIYNAMCKGLRDYKPEEKDTMLPLQASRHIENAGVIELIDIWGQGWRVTVERMQR